VHTIEDALARISQPQSDQCGLSEANFQILIESFPPVLVLHLNRVNRPAHYTATSGIVKVNRYIRFDPELEIPPGMSFSPSPHLIAKVENNSFVVRWPRFYSIDRWTTSGVRALQALWRTLPPWQVHKQRALYGLRSPLERRRRQ
jgi:hypothetical protein